MNYPQLFKGIIVLGFFILITGYIVTSNEHQKNMEVFYEKEIQSRQMLADSLKVEVHKYRLVAQQARDEIALIDIKKKQNKITLHAKKDSIARLPADTIQTLIESNLPD